MKTSLKIIIPIVAVLLLGGGLFYFFVLAPRLGVKLAMEEFLPFKEPAQYYTDFDVKNENVTTVENLYFAVDIPADYKKYNNPMDVEHYVSADESESIILLNSVQPVTINLLSPSNYSDSKYIDADMLEKGFEELGYGTPNNFYNSVKCALLVQEDDYDFWNINKSSAVTIALGLRSTTYTYDSCYLYEADDKYAVIQENYNAGIYTYYVDVLKPDSLSVPYSIIIKTKEPETAFAMINSLEFK